MRIVLALIALGVAFLFGAYTVKKETRLYSAMVVAGNWLLEKPAEFNFYRQYVLTKEKKPVPCPVQTKSTIVLVAIGQSNAANHLGQRFTSDKAVNFFGGKCYAAQDPLLGASGRQGSMWTLLGNKLAAQGREVVIVTAAIGSTSVGQWANGGELHGVLRSTLEGLPYKATHILWHQGEGDVGNTSAADYHQGLVSVISTTREFFPNSAFFVSIASACRGFIGISNEVQMGQRMTINPSARIFAGPNTDEFVSVEDRYDGCHFSGSAQAKISDLWLKTIRSHLDQPLHDHP